MRMPNWVSLSPRVSLIGMPITANIIQIIKHTVNAKVLAVTTDQALYCCVAIILLPPSIDELSLRIAKIQDLTYINFMLIKRIGRVKQKN
jgi:hypothetical protein